MTQVVLPVLHSWRPSDLTDPRSFEPASVGTAESAAWMWSPSKLPKTHFFGEVEDYHLWLWTSICRTSPIPLTGLLQTLVVVTSDCSSHLCTSRPESIGWVDTRSRRPIYRLGIVSGADPTLQLVDPLDDLVTVTWIGGALFVRSAHTACKRAKRFALPLMLSLLTHQDILPKDRRY